MNESEILVVYRTTYPAVNLPSRSILLDDNEAICGLCLAHISAGDLYGGEMAADMYLGLQI
jgi:hypothetical protein